MKKFILVILIVLLALSPIFAEKEYLLESNEGYSELENIAGIGLGYQFEKISFEPSTGTNKLNTSDHLFGFSVSDVLLFGYDDFRLGAFLNMSYFFGPLSLANGIRPTGYDKHSNFNFSLGPSFNYKFVPYLGIYDFLGFSMTLNSFEKDTSNKLSFFTFGVYNELGMKIDLIEGLSLSASATIIYEFGGLYTVYTNGVDQGVSAKFSSLQVRPSISILKSFKTKTVSQPPVSQENTFFY